MPEGRSPVLYRFGDYELDGQLYQLRRAGEMVELEPKVFDLLVYLMTHHERVVSKDELLDKLWPELVVSETALTQCVMAARKAVGDDGTRQHTIKTQHGRGYRFVAAVATVAALPVASSQEGGGSSEETAAKSQAEVEEGKTRIETETEEAPSPDVESHAQDSGLSPQHFPATRFTRSLVLAAVLLLTVTVWVVQYLSRPTLRTHYSGLSQHRRCWRCPTNPRLSCCPSST